MTAFDIDRVRAQFPALNNHPGTEPAAFLDNPGGTQVPQSVIDAIRNCLINANANLGGAFRTSRAADCVVAEARVAMADFFNARSPREVVFGQNMTTLTLHMSRSIGRRLEPGDEIIVTRMDHDANISPWLLLATDLGLQVKFLPFDTERYEFDLAELDALLTDRTRLVCINHASNLTGTINDVKALTASAHAAGALVYVDSVQYAPHGLVDVQAIDCDFLVCSPYKFFGPHMGVLWGREELLAELEPYKVRPASDALPDRFETGTLSHEGMAGVHAAVDYFAWIGREFANSGPSQPLHNGVLRRQALQAAAQCIDAYERPLAERLIAGLATIPDVTVHGITDSDAMHRRVPTVSFSTPGHHPKHVAEALVADDLFVWSGHNYALEPVKALGLLDTGGVVRIGLAHYNTAEEVEHALSAVERCLSRPTYAGRRN